jgi:hypothetical protein
MRAAGGVEFVIVCPDECDEPGFSILRTAATKAGLVTSEDSDYEVQFFKEKEALKTYLTAEWNLSQVRQSSYAPGPSDRLTFLIVYPRGSFPHL